MSQVYKRSRSHSQRSIMTRHYGRFISNVDLQNILLEDAVKAEYNGDYVLSDYLQTMVKNLEKLRD